MDVVCFSITIFVHCSGKRSTFGGVTPRLLLWAEERVKRSSLSMAPLSPSLFALAWPLRSPQHQTSLWPLWKAAQRKTIPLFHFWTRLVCYQSSEPNRPPEGVSPDPDGREKGGDCTPGEGEGGKEEGTGRNIPAPFRAAHCQRNKQNIFNSRIWMEQNVSKLQ